MKKILVLVLVLGLSSPAIATTTVFSIDAGAWVEEGYPGALRNESSLYVGSESAGDSAVLLKFDISSIPVSQIILSATVSLDFDGQVRSDGTASTIRGYKLLTDFVDDSSIQMSDWSAGPMLGTPGTDFGTTELFNLAAPGSTNPGRVDKSITSLVQDWYTNGGVTGLYIMMDHLASGQNMQKCDGHYGATQPSDHGCYLTVTYEIPEPMTIALLGLGSMFLRRRK